MTRDIDIKVLVDGQEVYRLTGIGVEVLKCACDHALAKDEFDGEEDRLYECATENGCGVFFTRANGQGRNGTLCPDCGKFGTKVGEGPICSVCEAAIMGEVEGWQCDECNEVFTGREDFLAHVKGDHDLGDAL